MFSLTLWAVLLIPLIFLIDRLWALAVNIHAAKASGIPYVVVPYSNYDRLTSILARYPMGILDKLLPSKSITSWRCLLYANWARKLRHAPFASLGSDTLLTVAPSGITLYTADANAISQITARSNDFVKPTWMYKSIDIFGKNIVSSSGAAWRHQRRLIGRSFTEKNNQFVWEETLQQTQAMLASWLSPRADGTGRGKTIHNIGDDTMRLSLHVISRAGLGQNMDWPDARDKELEESGQGDLPHGHAMSFKSSLQQVLRDIFIIMILPKWLLRKAPFARVRKAYRAYCEWGMYMREMLATKKAAIQSEAAGQSSKVDLIGQLVRSYDDIEDVDDHDEDNKVSNKPADGRTSASICLTDSEVMGNLFIFVIAGHETTSGSIHFSLLLLAQRPKIQRAVQRELDSILQGRPPSQWNYERDLPWLLNGLLGAVMNEQLRVLTPIGTIPATNLQTQSLTLADGRNVTVPAKTMIRMCAPSVHRNPKFWPYGPPRDATDPYWAPGNLDNDLEEFKPERWLVNRPPAPAPTAAAAAASGDEKRDAAMAGSGEATATATAAAAGSPPPPPPPLYTPPRGAYMPFSDGPRACLGRRFAQVETLAALAVILQHHSVELAVGDGDEDDEALRDAPPAQKAAAWRVAERRARRTLQEKTSVVLTLQLRGAEVVVRIVKRGSEIFPDME